MSKWQEWDDIPFADMSESFSSVNNGKYSGGYDADLKKPGAERKNDKPGGGMKNATRRQLRLLSTFLAIFGTILVFVYSATLYHSAASSFGHFTQRLSLTDRRETAPSLLQIAKGVPLPRVAYVVSFLSFQDPIYLDAAAVLAKSIALSHSMFPYDFVALVHKDAEEVEPLLKAMGIKVIVREIGIEWDAFQNVKLRDKAASSGCCGLKELLKLEALTLTEYYKVLHLDLDALVTGSLDPLLFQPSSTEFAFAFDRPMGKNGGLGQFCVQGGFLLLKPSMETYQLLIQTMIEGDFRDGMGWKGQVGWCYGGQTIQGLMAYYALGPGENISTEVDCCVYNSMLHEKNKYGEDCALTPPGRIQSVHFTSCQKPWSCQLLAEGTTCRMFQDRWFEIRQIIEEDLGLTPSSEHPCSAETQVRSIFADKEDRDRLLEKGLYLGLSRSR